MNRGASLILPMKCDGMRSVGRREERREERRRAGADEEDEDDSAAGAELHSPMLGRGSGEGDAEEVGGRKKK